jgi:hypothetical protein
MVAIDSKEAMMEESFSFSADVIPEEARASLLGAPTKPVNKPEIGHLPDAIVDGFPVFDVGDKIVIERRAIVLRGAPYLDTKTYKVLKVDLSNGVINLYDEELNQFAMDNWKTGLVHGHVYKFARGGSVSTKRKRGRPRKNPVEAAAPVAAAPLGPDGQPVKKRRGRPAGVKNRPKDVVAAEKAAKVQVRAAKKAARAAKRKGGAG